MNSSIILYNVYIFILVFLFVYNNHIKEKNNEIAGGFVGIILVLSIFSSLFFFNWKVFLLTFGLTFIYAPISDIFARPLASRFADPIKIAERLNKTAKNLLRKKEYHKSANMFDSALDMLEKAIGREHIIYRSYLNHIAINFFNARKYRYALEKLLTKEIIIDKYIDHYLEDCKEDEENQIKFVQEMTKGLYFLISTAILTEKLSKKEIFCIADTWIKRKSVVLFKNKEYNKSIYYDQNIETQIIIKTINDKTKELFDIYSNIEKSNRDEAIKQLLNEINLHKKRLIEKNDYYKANERKRTGLKEIQQSLDNNTVLIDFIHFPKFEFKSEYAIAQKNYYALFTLYDGSNIEFKIVGDADEIDEIISQLKNAISTSSNATYKKHCRKLYDLLLKPIKKHLGNNKSIYICADKEINFLPFEILLDENNQFLIENYKFNYLYSSRDIPAFGETIADSKNSLMIGDPDFEHIEECETFSFENSKDGDFNNKNLDFAFNESCIDKKRSLKLELQLCTPLPNTRDEIEKVISIIGDKNAKICLGKEATTDVLFSHINPNILHLATHGFFIPYNSASDKISFDSTRSFSIVDFEDDQVESFSIEASDPMDCSIIALAGANKSIRGETSKYYGIVTARNIRNLHLWGTRLVVLSACQTGLGTIKSGEGVFGFRRAFSQAGAKSLVMSMWKVPDRETTELMIDFYSNIFKMKMDYNDSLRQASLAQLYRIRKRYGHDNPFYWGGFIFSGDPNMKIENITITDT